MPLWQSELTLQRVSDRVYSIVDTIRMEFSKLFDDCTLAQDLRLSSRGSVRQCTSSDGDNAAPCLPRGLAVLDLLVLAS
ncbi:hypothetical protein Tco_0871069 [Tanacetum coccineum]